MIKVYPAIFEVDPVGFSIYFPDVEGAVTQGETIEEGLEMASDALGIMLADLIETNQSLPEPTPINKIVKENDGQFVTLVSVDLSDYLANTKPDRKTIYIPHWLNVRAEKAGINFSKTMSDALLAKLN
jgi:predicted RNase H-like HicB family nuclease